MVLSRVARIGKTASRQHGLITRRQLIGFDVPTSTIDRWIRIGRLERVHAGVYRLAGAVRAWRQGVLAACLAAGPRSIASNLTAARLWDLFERLDAPIEVTVPASSHPLDAGFIVHRSVRCPDRLHEIDGIPVTSPGRTLTDLARCLPYEQLEEVFDTATRKGLLSDEELEVLSMQRVFRSMLDDRSGDRGPSGSQRETLLRQVLRAAGLPSPIAQYEVGHRGWFVANVDFAYPEQKIAIEYDGYETHSSRAAFERDRKRWQKLQAAGYAIQPFTRADLKRPVSLTSSLYRLLVDRGHPDVAH